MTSPFTGPSRGHTKTLANVLAAGPMALSAALQCATEIAAALREIHEQGRAHGKVTADTVAILANGAELLRAPNSWEQGDTERDVREFGALLFHMLAGAPLQAGEVPVASRLPGPRTGPAGLRASALQLAGGCFGEGSFQPTMQQVLTELRLLAVLLKMQENGDSPLPPMAKPPRTANQGTMPAPFLVMPTPQPVRLAPAAPLVSLGPASFGQPAYKAPAAEAPRGGRCPSCGCSMVFVSRPHSTFENLLVRMKIPLCRCHRCHHRYVVLSQLTIGKEMPAGSQRKRTPYKRKP